MAPLILVAAAFIGIGTLGVGRLSRSPGRPVALPRLWGLLSAAVVPQFLWTHGLSRWSDGSDLLAWLIPLSYVPILVFLAANRRHAWARVILVGTTLNLLVIVVNGGAMPARVAEASNVSSPVVAVSYLAPGTKDRVVASSLTIPLEHLGDRYLIALPGGATRLASVGDLVVLAGALIALVSAARTMALAPGPLPAVGPADAS